MKNKNLFLKLSALFTLVGGTVAFSNYLYNISSKKESAAAGFEGIYDAAIQHLYNIVNGKKEVD